MKHLLHLILACLPCLPAAGSAASKPNIIVILADDQGWGDLSLNGNSNLATPHLDSLARAGAVFDRFYVCPVCSPTRAEFLTGRYHPRGGVRGVSQGGERLNLGEQTIADTLKAAGYKTGAFGKWHNGTQWPYHPNARGFDEFYGFTSGHWGSYFDAPLDHNGQVVQGRGFITDDLTDHALQFIEANRRRPFFCYVPYNTPHSPMQVPERFWKKFATADLKLRNRNPQQESPDFTRAALAMCENIDWNVGRILRRLDELELAENTIVIYFSDNGPNGWRWNGGMKGRKGSTDEGGVRSPFLIRWPGRIPAGTRIPQIAGAIDLLPTLENLAGVPSANGKPLDGIDLAPLLTGTARDWPDRMIFSHWGGKVSVRTQRHRLDAAGKLFDMRSDPGQDRDIAKEQPDIAARLSKAAAEWRDEMLPGLTTARSWSAIPGFRSPNFPPVTVKRTAASGAAPARPTALTSAIGPVPPTPSPGTSKSPPPAATRLWCYILVRRPTLVPPLNSASTGVASRAWCPRPTIHPCAAPRTTAFRARANPT
jgi:arylsulfatase A-like enzyme